MSFKTKKVPIYGNRSFYCLFLFQTVHSVQRIESSIPFVFSQVHLILESPTSLACHLHWGTGPFPSLLVSVSEGCHYRLSQTMGIYSFTVVEQSLGLWFL